jgi:hypothetical protein
MRIYTYRVSLFKKQDRIDIDIVTRKIYGESELLKILEDSVKTKGLIKSYNGAREFKLWYTDSLLLWRFEKDYLVIF